MIKCDCDQAKKGYIILNKMKFENIAVMCLKCDKVWYSESPESPDRKEV
jgi:hypothetical protein